MQGALHGDGRELTFPTHKSWLFAPENAYSNKGIPMRIPAHLKQRTGSRIPGWEWLNGTALARECGWDRRKVCDTLTGRRDAKLFALARLSHYLKMPIPDLIERIARAQRIDREWHELRLERDRRRVAEMDSRLTKKGKPADEPDQTSATGRLAGGA